MKYFHLIFLVIASLLCATSASWACPSCYGAQDSPMTAGMNTAILVMLGIIGSVLMSFVAFFLYLWRRYKRQQSALSDEAFVNEDGIFKTKHEKGIVEWNNF